MTQRLAEAAMFQHVVALVRSRCYAALLVRLCCAWLRAAGSLRMCLFHFGGRCFLLRGQTFDFPAKTEQTRLHGAA
jgi:hypothetical protein